jgi:hypothetical protein
MNHIAHGAEPDDQKALDFSGEDCIQAFLLDLRFGLWLSAQTHKVHDGFLVSRD